VEAGEPAEAVAVAERDELGVYWSEYRRLPAERRAAIATPQDSDPARRQYGKRQGAVINLDQIDAVAQPAVERAFPNRPSQGRVGLHVARPGGERVQPNVAGHVGQSCDDRQHGYVHSMSLAGAGRSAEAMTG